ncbi:MAG: PP-loop family protein [Desulfovibrio sp.]|uniref:PP-loop family protein n=1 Tax=Desulfovibrio sp. TaxID=885 RepID=UPI001A784D66|nr:PP-loop family protein [Desulfovibrio sp.]MBD5417934.1 PP-loop family protein [Desulfovibrio sp.]
MAGARVAGGLEAKAARLREVLSGIPRMAVAFSGGLDSRFLCHAAQGAGCDLLLIHGAGPHVPPEESAEAEAWARARDIPIAVERHDPLLLPEVAANSRERCYACKRALIASVRAALESCEEENLVLCDGGNLDDLKAFRPGLRAVAEAGVRSPLAEAGLAKADIRALAAATGLDRPDQPARPCLLTRLAYGMEPTAGLLARVARAEAALAALDAADREAQGQDGGFGDFRLRLKPAPVFQCSRLPARLTAALEEIMAAHGFAPFTLVTGEKVSGFFDAGTR